MSSEDNESTTKMIKKVRDMVSGKFVVVAPSGSEPSDKERSIALKFNNS